MGYSGARGTLIYEKTGSRVRLPLKLAKSAKISKKIILKIPYRYHKTQNSMLSLNPLK